LPKAEPWLTRGRIRSWTTILQSWLAEFGEHAHTQAAQRIFPGDALARAGRQWTDPEPLLQAFERLPVCFCHHDAFRRNLFARRTEAGVDETVAIDWAITGFGRVGEESGITAANATLLFDIPARQVREVDGDVFAGCVEGLHASGWRGDVRQARLGYAVNALVIAAFIALSLFAVPRTREGKAPAEGFVQRPWDDIVECCAETLPFFLDLGDEASALAAAM
jgi:hypothetical protein